MKDEPSVTEAQVLAAVGAAVACQSDSLHDQMRAALSAAALAQPKPGEMGELVDLLTRRIGQEFDGECHLTEAEARQIAASLSASHARAEALQAEVDGLREDCAIWESRAKGFKARLATVEKALEPFAREADDWPADTPAHVDAGDYDNITVGDLRRARTLLSGETAS